MNIHHFTTPRHISWDGDHSGSAEVYLVAFCADAAVSQEMLALAESLGAGAELVAHDFGRPTFVAIDTGHCIHADEVTSLVFTSHAEHAAQLAQLFGELHAKHYLHEDGAHHWMRHATAEEIEVHHRVNAGLPHLHPDELTRQIAVHRGEWRGMKARLPHDPERPGTAIEQEIELHRLNEGLPWVPHALRTKVPDEIAKRRERIEALHAAHIAKRVAAQSIGS